MSRHPRRADKGIDKRTGLTPKSTFHRGAKGAAGGVIVLSRVCGTGHNNNSQAQVQATSTSTPSKDMMYLHRIRRVH